MVNALPEWGVALSGDQLERLLPDADYIPVMATGAAPPAWETLNTAKGVQRGVVEDILQSYQAFMAGPHAFRMGYGIAVVMPAGTLFLKHHNAHLIDLNPHALLADQMVGKDGRPVRKAVDHA